MIPIVSNLQMRECDRVTIEDIGLPGIVLMENAARSVTEVATEMLDGDVSGSRILVFCGKGNNGGDGFAVARLLQNAGAEITLFLIGKKTSLNGDTKLNCQLFQKLGGKVSEVKNFAELPASDFVCDLIVDGLLGTGMKGKTRGLYDAVICKINEISAPVLSIDIPSGVNGDTGQTAGEAVSADRTVSFGLLKCGLIFSPGKELSGQISIADIGIPPQVIKAQNISCQLVEPSDVRLSIPRRHPTAHKGDVGVVYLLAGSPGMTGAATLAARGAIRSGAGLTTVGVPLSLNQIMEVKLTETMTHGLPETEFGYLSLEALPNVTQLLGWADVFAFGPGMGRHPETQELLTNILKKTNLPTVIDADGLYMLSKNRKLLNNLPDNCVLTPHTGEFIRLAEISMKELYKDRLKIASEFAIKWKTIIVLKGPSTVIAAPDGSTFVTMTGNTGMATGGSGDVLMGIIAGFIAQGLNPLKAAWTGTFIMGKAGDRASMEKGQHGMLAGDIVDCLPYAIKELYDA